MSPAHITSNMAAKQGNFSKKAALSDSDYINSVPDGENTNIGQAVPEKHWRVRTHPWTCARRFSFTGDFSKTAERISTKLSR